MSGSGSGSVETTGVILRRNFYPALAMAALFAFGVGFTKYGGRDMAPLGLLAAWFGGFFAPILLLRNAFPLRTATTIRASDSGLQVGGYGDIALEDIVETRVVPRGHEAVIDFALRNGRTLRLSTTPQDAHAITHVLGARRSRFRLEVPYVFRYFAAVGALQIMWMVLFGDAAALLYMMLPTLFVSVLIGWALGFLRGQLVIGVDGITRRWLFWERFTAFRDMQNVGGVPRFMDRPTHDTAITLANSRVLRLRTIEAPNTEADRGAESRAMLWHVMESFQRSRHMLDGTIDVPALVKRGSRTAREWLAGLDAVVRGGGNQYRVAAVSPEMLADVAMDPTAPAESRIGAAAALIRIGDEKQRTRVRIAAEACAETELRDTLLAVSDARDDFAAEAALERCRAPLPVATR